MSFLGLVVLAILVAAGSATVGSLPPAALRFEERAVIGLVLTVLLGSALTYLLALLAGMSPATVLLGAALLPTLAAALCWRRRAVVIAAWGDAWRELVDPAARRHLAGVLATVAAATLVFTLLFAHTLSTDATGSLNAGFVTVWADWAQHLTTASSFAVTHNLPPQNPLFSGQDLRYPFLPDFHSATLLTLGASPALALALPGAVLAVCITLLITLLGVRLGAGMVAGALAAAICFIGGGLGFTGILADACLHHGFSSAQCTWGGLVAHPSALPGIIAGTLRELPAVLTAQPRAYDGLLTPADQQPLANQQWYTPLFAWWLPQRSLLYGFSAALAVLLLVAAAVRSPQRQHLTFAVCGVTLGLLPLVHIHTLIAMAIALAVLAAVPWRRREWWVLVACTVVVAAPRLFTLLGGPHGTASAGNLFPTVEPGWMYLGGNTAREALSVASLVGGVGALAAALVSPAYWAFWIGNTGVALPLCVIALLAVAASRLEGRAGAAARRVSSVFPRDVLAVAFAFTTVFAVANLVVFQSWDWDNTKLLAYWYLGAALLAGTLIVRWWRRWWRGVAAAAMAGTLLLTGLLVLLRLLPWTPAEAAVGGPYTVASADEMTLAATVASVTSARSVFLTEGRPNDPLLTIAGRNALMGYYGWLWSYGTDFGTRYTDVHTMYEGCHSQARSQCAVFPLLRRYHVDYVEIDDRLTSAGVIDDRTDVTWWAAQHFPVVASSAHITVYDVRAG